MLRLSFLFVVAVFVCCILLGLAFTRNQRCLLQSCSEDGAYCASVVVSEKSRGNGSDVYITRVKARSYLSWSHWSSFGNGEAILNTTAAAPTHLIWNSDIQLAVRCDHCKMNYGDVWNEKNQVEKVAITYFGFVRPLD
jgi:hypothetical protein